MDARERVLKALDTSVIHPKTGKGLAASGAIESVSVTGDFASITLSIAASDAEAMEPVRKACEAAAKTVPGIARARAIMTAQSAGAAKAQHPAAGAAGRTPPPTPKPIKGLKKIIAVASGKGGVGKSTTAVNLAFALQQSGMRTAFIDCDIYGPSAAVLLGLAEKPRFTDDNRILPVYRDGVAAMSMSFIVDSKTAAIWRGPMVIQAVQQFLTGVAWDELGPIDIAVVDLPPGTGDVQLTLAQTANIDGAIIVSTPQDLALIDARKAIDMFSKTGIPILGIVENMSYFACPHCGERSDIFGHGGARAKAVELGIPFLGEIPLEIAIRESSDAGRPIVSASPDSEHAQRYRRLADIVAHALDGPKAE
jgi:ATP-binding protein involved in chromosome partitioning